MKTIKFSPGTGATRLFKSYNLAQEWFPNALLVVRPSMFHGFVDHRRFPIPIENMYADMFNWGLDRDAYVVLDENTFISKRNKVPITHPRSFHNLDDKDQHMWDLAWEIGDLVETPPYHAYSTQKSNSHSVLAAGFVVDLQAAQQTIDLVEKKQIKLPKQAVAIAKRFIDEQFDFYTSEEMRKFMSSSRTVMAINTRQDPWRIFRYYRKALISNKILVDNSGE